MRYWLRPAFKGECFRTSDNFPAPENWTEITKEEAKAYGYTVPVFEDREAKEESNK